MAPRDYQIAFIALWLYRYVRLIGNCVSAWTFKSIPPPDNPTYTPGDVTYVIPTICREDQHGNLERCLRSCLETKPYGSIISTIESNLLRIADLAYSIDPRIQVIAASFANKRRQICEAIPRITTSITILADDDIELPSKPLPHILAPFEDRNVGAVGTRQRVRRRSDLGIIDQTCQYIGAGYIERRNFEISATSHIDGRISCLPDRTAALRTEVLLTKDFMRGYLTKTWFRRPLNPDNDNFVTRFLVTKG